MLLVYFNNHEIIFNIPDLLFNHVICYLFTSWGETPEQNGQPRSFYSRIDEQTNEMILLTYKTLDYEAIPQYTLTIKAAVRYIFTVL